MIEFQLFDGLNPVFPKQQSFREELEVDKLSDYTLILFVAATRAKMTFYFEVVQAGEAAGAEVAGREAADT